MSPSIIQCSHLGKCYAHYQRPIDRLLDGFRSRRPGWLGGRSKHSPQKFWALRDINLTLEPGEAVAIIGRNGSGKSTLLQLIAGTLNPTCGEVRVQGRVCAMLELGTGFNPEFTGVENALLYSVVLGLSAEEATEKLPSILAFAEIGEHAGQPVKTYSSGMYVRLAFAVMIHAAPEVLIVDEALSVGDAAFQAKCMAWVRRFQAEGGSLLFVSHDVSAVRALCSRAIYLEQGRIKATGPTGEVTDLYLHDVHQAQNTALLGSSLQKKTAPPAPRSDLDPAFAARSEQFQSRWIDKRQGTGDALVRLVELLDDAGQPLEVIEFDAPVTLRIYVECVKACRVSVNYKVRDRHLVAVVGADFLISGVALLDMQPGDFQVVEYRTRFPLMDGDYSLRLSITEPIERHAQALFHDIVEVALSFKILPSPLGWIYTQTYLPNDVSVKPLALGTPETSNTVLQPLEQHKSHA